MDDDFDYDEARGILCSWEGRDVLVIAYISPGPDEDVGDPEDDTRGVSLRPFGGILTITDDDNGMLHAEVSPGPGTQEIRMAFNTGLFHHAEWVPGMDERGLAIEHGAIRVD